jgi:isoquinoline 1-oxidoreductase alpha subunit
VGNGEIVTIEGISENGDNPVQLAWIKEDVPQCGYCQAGQIMTATALLNQNPNPTDEEIEAAMAGNLCRCGTYIRLWNVHKNQKGGKRSRVKPIISALWLTRP